MTFKDATDRLGVPLERIAEATGRSYMTIVGYRAGQREAPADVWRALADFAREHAADVRALVKEFNAVARELERAEKKAEK